MEKKTLRDKKSDNDVALDDDYVGSVLASLDEQMASLDENNINEDETVEKDVFTKKPIAQSPESREEMIKAEEWLQELVSLSHTKAPRNSL